MPLISSVLPSGAMKLLPSMRGEGEVGHGPVSSSIAFLPYTTSPTHCFAMGPFLSPADATERTHDNAFNRANVCAAMLLASLLVPLAVLAIVFLIQRLRIPAFLAIMATVVVYGIAADMTFMSVGKA